MAILQMFEAWLPHVTEARRSLERCQLVGSLDDVYCLCTAGFYAAVWMFVGIILVGMPLLAAADWAEALLKLEWRQHLTSQLLRTYFSNRAFYNLKLQADTIDNPDQVPMFKTICIHIAAIAVT